MKTETPITTEYLNAKGWVREIDEFEETVFWVLRDDAGEEVFTLDMESEGPHPGYIGNASDYNCWPCDIAYVEHLEKIIEALTC